MDSAAQTINNIISILICDGLLFVSVLCIGHWIEELKSREVEWLQRKTKNKTLTNLIVYRLTFPGTILHELSHAMVASFLGAKVTKIQCFSIRKNTLGYVNFKTRGRKIAQMLQISLSACAPVLMGLFMAPLCFRLMWISKQWKWKLLFAYLMISSINHMNMSSVDIENYKKGKVAVIMSIFCVLYLILTLTAQ